MVPLTAKAYFNGRLLTKSTDERANCITSHDIIRLNYPGKFKIEYDPTDTQTKDYQSEYFEIVQKSKYYFEVWQYTTEFEKLKEEQNFELLANLV